MNISCSLKTSLYKLSLQKNPVLITDLRNDMKAECEKFGEVRKVIVFDVSIDIISCTFCFFTFERDSSKLRPPIDMVMQKINVHRNLSFPLLCLRNINCSLHLKNSKNSPQNLVFTTILIVMAPNILLDFPHNSSEEWSYFPP